MESICRAYHHPHQTPLHLFPRPAAPKTLITFKPSPHKPSFTPLRASHDPIRTPHTPKPSTNFSLLPAAAATLAAAAALILARFHTPLLAADAAPVAQSETLPSSDPSETPTLTDYEKEISLEEHLDSHPDDVRAIRSLMELKVKSGKLPDAISAVDRLIVLQPHDKDLPLLKAHLQSYSGDFESANLAFEALLEADPFLVEAYHGLVMTASQSEGELGGILKRVEAAMENCAKAKRNDELRDFKLLVAQIRVIEGNYEEALKVYQKLVQEEPRDFRPYLCQGIIYTLLRKKDEAEKQFKKYKRLVPRGHPYAQYFDDNMIAMKVFSQVDENQRKGTLKI